MITPTNLASQSEIDTARRDMALLVDRCGLQLLHLAQVAPSCAEQHRLNVLATQCHDLATRIGPQIPPEHLII